MNITRNSEKAIQESLFKQENTRNTFDSTALEPQNYREACAGLLYPRRSFPCPPGWISSKIPQWVQTIGAFKVHSKRMQSMEKQLAGDKYFDKGFIIADHTGLGNIENKINHWKSYMSHMTCGQTHYPLRSESKFWYYSDSRNAMIQVDTHEYIQDTIVAVHDFMTEFPSLLT